MTWGSSCCTKCSVFLWWTTTSTGFHWHIDMQHLKYVFKNMFCVWWQHVSFFSSDWIVQGSLIVDVAKIYIKVMREGKENHFVLILPLFMLLSRFKTKKEKEVEGKLATIKMLNFNCQWSSQQIPNQFCQNHAWKNFQGDAAKGSRANLWTVLSSMWAWWLTATQTLILVIVTSKNGVFCSFCLLAIMPQMHRKWQKTFIHVTLL